MAFAIPSHLPRKRDNDVSTKLLTKMSETPSKALTYELASSWVAELNEAIRQTKKQIHERIQSTLPAFEEQLSTSRLVQERLLTLSNNVDNLGLAISHPETGLIPKLVVNLTQHATLAQEVTDAQSKSDALTYLSRCKRGLTTLTKFSDEGRLPEATETCKELEELLASPPKPLEESVIHGDLKRKCRTVKDRTHEQVAEAFSRGIVVSSHEIAIRSSIQVRQSETVLSLSSILTSLPPASLTDHLSTLRRDLTTHYIEFILSQPTTVEVFAEGTEAKLTIFLAPPLSENRISRVDNLAFVFSFLKEHLFPHLPLGSNFPLTFCKPVTTALLSKLLIPSLPSSQDQLPQFLDLVRSAVNFEEEYIVKVLGDTSFERDIEAWAAGVATHYECKRRTEILDRARFVILREENVYEHFRVEVLVVPDTPKEPEAAPEPLPAPVMEKAVPPASILPPVVEDDTAWGFEDDGDGSAVPVDEDGWGFDDDAPIPEEPPEPTKAPDTTATAEEDPGDAWGWNDEEPSPADEAASEDSSAWDDPWGDEPAPAPTTTPKVATKLGKHTKTNGTASLAQSSSVSVAPPAAPATKPPAKAPEPLVLKEFYLVSGRMKELMSLVEDVLRESLDLSTSGIFASTSGTSPGSIIGQTGAMILDLYRGLYPVSRADQFKKAPKETIGFSNACLWTSDEIERILVSGRITVSPSAKEKLIEGQRRLKVIGESWFEDITDSECQRVNDALDGANGFIETADQERFDECEAVINSVLQGIRRWSQQIKPVLTKSKYYSAIGFAVDTALSRILKDVLTLSDIPEEESHKLSELCHILNALEALFVEDPEQPSFVVAYVPSWLKFSYLSELLEASIADISYLFEEGALVDFEIEELVKLVQALFADTPLRTNTVNKLMQGHPIQT